MSEKDRSFEDLMQELETLVAKLEGDELHLDDAIKQNEQALKLIQLCRERLNTASQKIDKLVRSSDGEFEKQPMD